MTLAQPSLPKRVCRKLVSLSQSAKIGVMLGVDLAGLPLCSLMAMLLRLGDVQAAAMYGIAPHLLITLITVPVLAATGLYGAVIRFIDHRLLSATGMGLAAVVVLTFAASSTFNYKGLPHTALMVYGFIAFSYIVTTRLLARYLLRNANPARARPGQSAMAIYGAGEAGVKLAVAMRSSERYRAVCFFDDKAELDNRNAAGLRIFHSARLEEILELKHVELIVIAIPSASRQQRRDIVNRLHQAGVAVKILFSLVELKDDEISARSIREIKVDDLLGREAILPDPELFAKCVYRKSILVTGAGGSIGSELCRQVATQQPAALHLLDHSEHALYTIEQELRRAFPRLRICAHLGSACNETLVDHIMDAGRIDTVYHAAAYKHVPLVEANMAEGIRNNVRSAQVVAEAAERHGIRTCVMVSTDKAIRPTSIMGASKRVAELVFQAAAMRARNGTRFCMVRFGNVLGSSGSVVPLFRYQIEHGGPVTVTHKDVVRYFMSIPEAAQLVVQAGAMAVGGDVFVMDMGEPVKIVDLARTMISMYGLRERDAANPDGDIEIRYVGLRPGEKLYEELFDGDNAMPSRHPRIRTTSEYVVQPDILAQQIAYLMVACATGDNTTIKSLMQKLVKGYTPERDTELRAPAVEFAGSAHRSPAHFPAPHERAAFLKRGDSYGVR